MIMSCEISQEDGFACTIGCLSLGDAQNLLKESPARTLKSKRDVLDARNKSEWLGESC
jgi:hypothetical protein